MENLYQFLEQKYNECEFKNEIDFDKFIEGFLDGSFHISSEHEAFWFDNDYLGTFNMTYKVDHKKQEIKLLFE
jgi:hypothetical protein